MSIQNDIDQRRLFNILNSHRAQHHSQSEIPSFHQSSLARKVSTDEHFDRNIDKKKQGESIHLGIMAKAHRPGPLTRGADRLRKPYDEFCRFHCPGAMRGPCSSRRDATTGRARYDEGTVSGGRNSRLAPDLVVGGSERSLTPDHVSGRRNSRLTPDLENRQ